MRKYYAYIRVSTTKQGEQGSSLTEQKDAILRYAAKNDIAISAWFEEQVTAAKRGRTVFRRMLSDLKRGKSDGLIMHKVDRGARNLADWAELASLMDIGIDVHFAHEALDLGSRGGRLSADIQAVVASDYIRNLREEVKKGIYGRLKQGIYPFAAPPGYLNNGKGQLKTIDPVQGPLIREAFTLYATGDFGLHRLREHMNERGLRNIGGRPFNVSGLATMLANPFYYGLIVVKGQSFIGKHEPLISKALVDACRENAEGKLVSATRRWGTKPYRYRRMLTCSRCNIRLIAETQRGHVYYRCHTKERRGTRVREEGITEAIQSPLHYFNVPPLLETQLRAWFVECEEKRLSDQNNAQDAMRFKQAELEARRNRLADLLIDGTIDKQVYHSRKSAIDAEAIGLTENLKHLADPAHARDRAEQFIEHAKSLCALAQSENEAQINETVNSAISNILVSGKSLEIQWSNAFLMLFDLGGFLSCALDRQADRTCIHSVTTCNERIKEKVSELYKYVSCIENDDKSHSSTTT